MVLDSRQYAIWQELVRLFQIEPQTLDGVTIPSLAPTIVPVVDVLRSVAPAFTRADTIAAAAPDSRTIATVPQDEYWLIHRMSINQDSGDRTLRFIGLEAPLGGEARLMLSLGDVDGLGRKVVDISEPLLIPPGSEIIINDDAGTTNSGWSLFTFRREFPIKV